LDTAHRSVERAGTAAGAPIQVMQIARSVETDAEAGPDLPKKLDPGRAYQERIRLKAVLYGYASRPPPFDGRKRAAIIFYTRNKGLAGMPDDREPVGRERQGETQSKSRSNVMSDMRWARDLPGR
jgi:hypothetical protein